MSSDSIPPNQLYQFSVVSALMDGAASEGLPMSKLLQHGDHGLGTFQKMQGELIVVDGEGYQMRHDGTLRKVDLGPNGDITPFGMVTKFEPSKSSRADVSAKDGVEPILAKLCPNARNTHVAFRLDGAFKSITVRTAEGQCFPGEGLKEVSSRQKEMTLGPSRGTVVGFRSPAFLQGVVVAGVHMHFIDDERTAGGHVLALETDGEVDVQVAEIWRTVMDLPQTEEFNKASLKLDSDGIHSVEG